MAEDRWPFKTAIPPLLQYPVSDRAFDFVSALVWMFYAPGWAGEPPRKFFRTSAPGFSRVPAMPPWSPACGPQGMRPELQRLALLGGHDAA